MLKLDEKIKQVTAVLSEGKPILLLDDNTRENEGDLVIAAEKITPGGMNFLIKQGSGVVCLALSKKLLEKLAIPMMLPSNTNRFETPFTVSIEAKHGVTTGVSAADRTHTVLTAMNDECKPSDLARPGHMFPLAARTLGVFERMGHTEGSIDLMNIAGLKPGAVLCELMNADGSMTIGQARDEFAKNHQIPIISVEDILFYRIRTEPVAIHSRDIQANFGIFKHHQMQGIDGTVIDIFRSRQAATSAKVKVVLAEDMKSRYLANVLSLDLPDPLINRFAELEKGAIDTVVVASKKDRLVDHFETNEHRRMLAWSLRALQELGVMGLRNPEPDLLAIAKDNFYFDCE